METNKKYLSIPPHISTNWKNVRSLHMKESHLIITMIDGSSINIPNLDQQAIENIFIAHSKYMEDQNHFPEEPRHIAKPQQPPTAPNSHQALSNLLQNGMDNSFRIGIGGPGGLDSVLQHDIANKNAPDLPPEILQKISAIAQIVVPENSDALPQAEPHCNCMHCQIARAITQGSSNEVIKQEEAITHEEDSISDDDLSFREWDIDQVGDLVYTVSNPLDKTEKFTVHLGDPVGCTCGEENCEHIIAVLRS